MTKSSYLIVLALLAALLTQPAQAAVDADGDGVNNASDCAPLNPNIYPGATETCDNVDEDCDGVADNGLATNTFYRDADRDGFGDSATTSETCRSIGPRGYVSNADDCDDSDSAIHPRATETCDGADNDCDGTNDEFWSTDDADSDGVADCADAETCDGVDNDGDGEVDEDVQTTYYRDVDGDGYGDDSDTAASCDAPDGYVALGGDCDDEEEDTRPEASLEVCADGIDNDCDGSDEPCVGDPNDPDGDAHTGDMDNCPDAYDTTLANNEGDSEGDVCDADDDNDSVADTADAFPFDELEWLDTDSDGTGDNADDDYDGDGVADTDEDSDGDGLTDDVDAFPSDPTETTDTDGDRTGDNGDSDADEGSGDETATDEDEIEIEDIDITATDDTTTVGDSEPEASQADGTVSGDSSGCSLAGHSGSPNAAITPVLGVMLLALVRLTQRKRERA